MVILFLSVISGDHMGTKERRDREKKIRRKTILKAARTLFFERGFTGTSMDQIAHKVELSKGTLYLYFRNKEELYVSLLFDGLTILNRAFLESLKNKKDWEAKLKALGWAYYHYAIEYRHYFHINFLFQHGEITANISDTLYDQCFNEGLKCLTMIAKCIEEGIHSGCIQKQDPMAIAVILWGSLNGIIMLHEGKDHRKFMPAPLDTLVGKSISILIEGLKQARAPE